jgi:hypothetical protein
MPQTAATNPAGTSPNEADPADVINQVRVLLEAHYVFPDIAAAVSGVLAEGLAAGRYPSGAPELAAAVTADLQSVNGDKHLRLQYHDEALAARTPGDDVGELAYLARWADRACGGVACAQRLAGNVGYLDLQPILFPAAICGEIITAAMSLIAATDALLLDLRHCAGGEPGMAVFVASYLWDHDPCQLTGLRERQDSAPRQRWTLPYVPGRRFGKTKPVYVLTSSATFSGGEELAYDLQQLGRATVVGERTRGGAHAREGFPLHPHLEATIPVAVSVNPVTGGNWEGTGLTPDIEVSASQARDTAYRLALQAVIAAGTPSAAEASSALASTRLSHHQTAGSAGRDSSARWRRIRSWRAARVSSSAGVNRSMKCWRTLCTCWGAASSMARRPAGSRQIRALRPSAGLGSRTISPRSCMRRTWWDRRLFSHCTRAPSSCAGIWPVGCPESTARIS